MIASRENIDVSSSREPDPTLRGLYNKLSHSRNNRLQLTIQACNEIAQYMERKHLSPTYPPYVTLLEQLASRAMLSECWEIIDEMQDVGLPPTLVALNYVLKAAVDVPDYASIERVCEMINNLEPEQAITQDTMAHSVTPEQLKLQYQAREDDDEALAAERSSTSTSKSSSPLYEPPPLPPGIAMDTTNFNTMTYAQLFRYCLTERKPEHALVLFSALVSSRPTAVEAFRAYMRPQGAEYLVNLLLRCHELRLATDIIDWLHVEGLGRVVPSHLWMDFARACAQGNYHPGLKLAWGRLSEMGGYIAPDEGFLLAALSTASRSADSALCLSLIGKFLQETHGKWVATPEPGIDAPAPPLQHPHLVPLLEALASEGKYREMTRLAGAMAHWGIELDGSCFDVAAQRAGTSRAELAAAISEWQRVIDEGNSSNGNADDADKTANVTLTASQRARLIQDVVQGNVPSLRGAVETNTMNALIRAAASLGETEEALNIWEERRYVKSRSPPLHISSTQEYHAKAQGGTTPRRAPPPLSHDAVGNPTGEYNPIQPNADTFNSLLLVAINRSPPSRDLAESLYREMRRSFASVEPTALTFERLIAVHVLPTESTFLYTQRDNARLLFGNNLHINHAPSNANVARAFEYFEACKEQGVVPSRNAYELLIRTSLRRPKDIRWIDLTIEMVKEAKYAVPYALSTFIAMVEAARRQKGELQNYELVWETYVRDYVADRRPSQPDEVEAAEEEREEREREPRDAREPYRRNLRPSGARNHGREGSANIRRGSHVGVAREGFGHTRRSGNGAGVASRTGGTRWE